MENLPEQNEVQKTKNNAVHIIAIISLVAFIIAVIASLVLIALKLLSFFDFLLLIIPCIIELILLFSLDNAIQRIEILENALLKKGVIDEQEIKSEPKYESEIELPENCSKTDIAKAGIKFCKECGYQLFPENKVCPNCGTNIENN